MMFISNTWELTIGSEESEYRKASISKNQINDNRMGKTNF